MLLVISKGLVLNRSNCASHQRPHIHAGRNLLKGDSGHLQVWDVANQKCQMQLM